MLIILGPPGGGKGTQGRMVSEFLGVQYVSAGDSLKNRLKNDVERMEKIHSGQIIEDIMVNSFIAELADSMEYNSVFEGFPRTQNQCEYLLSHLEHKKVHGVVILEVGKPTLLNRLCRRYVCVSCYRPENFVTTCCGAEMAKRKDDEDIRAIEKRLEIFMQNIVMIEEIFLKHGISVVHVNGELAKDEIRANIVEFYSRVI